jgi:RNA polymerase sigma-70 factor (ECF subfamily)
LFADETALVAALRAGNEAAFVRLVATYHANMLRLAHTVVSDDGVAEEVTQEAWVGVLRGLARFEGRSSLKTWIFTILMNCARKRSERERRTVPFSMLFREEEEEGSTVSPERFYPEGAWRGHWRRFPMNWNELPEERVLAQETLALSRKAIDSLPPGQRAVILLRDVDGCSATEVCNILQISESNQRVLLHRARAQVRRVLEQYFEED